MDKMNKQIFGNVFDTDTVIYMGLFENIEDVFSNFCVDEENKIGVDIVFAAYEYEDYSGSAFVIFMKDGILYEVNGGHCSCNGLEGQWEPEETSLEALMFRPNVPNEAKANLKKIYRNLISFL
jgi:hypothetical protein